MKMREDIEMDSHRVFLESDFFGLLHIKRILQEVAYVWSKNSFLGYQQGMLYILGVVVYVVYHSLNSDFYSDSFMIFDRIMKAGLWKLFTHRTSEFKKICDRIVCVWLKLVDIEYFILIDRQNIDVSIFIMYLI